MTNANSKKGVIAISVVAVLVITSVILYLSLSDFGSEKVSDVQPVVASDASPGENNSEVKPEMTPEEVQGIYKEAHDGWFYSLVYSPNGEYDGTYSAGYDPSHVAVPNNPEKDYTEQGTWKLHNGEVKLYSEAIYRKSLWACGDYIVDSQNYFVGHVPDDKENFQSAFMCKPAGSGDTQIFNFYSDGKMIMEIIRNDGEADSAADSSAGTDDEPELPPYQAVVGNYTIAQDKIIIKFIDESEKVFYIVDDGIAGWVYNKVVPAVD